MFMLCYVLYVHAESREMDADSGETACDVEVLSGNCIVLYNTVQCSAVLCSAGLGCAVLSSCWNL
jgi:hypothetical protein